MVEEARIVLREALHTDVYAHLQTVSHHSESASTSLIFQDAFMVSAY